MGRWALAAAGAAGLVAVAFLSTRRPPEPLPVPAKPQRIVPMSFAACEIVLELVEPARIAAVPASADHSPYSSLRGRLGGFPRIPAEPEALLAVRPDLVLTASYLNRETLEGLDRAGIPHQPFTDFRDVESILAAVRTIGDRVGEPEKARELEARCRNEIARLRASIPAGAPAPRVISLNQDGTTAGADTTFDSLATLAGARNLAAEAGIRGFGLVSAEQLLLWNPDAIVVGVDPDTGAGAHLRLREDPALAPLRDRRVVQVPLAEFTSVSHHVLGALRRIVEGLYR
jgi:iron complex transport system substrate-binding protein